MDQPEQYRDEVYLAEGYVGEPLRGEVGARVDVPRAQGDQDPMGQDPLRENAGRETQPREAGRESTGRDAGSREMTGRRFGAPLPAGNPLPGGSGADRSDALGHKAAPPGRALSTSSPGAASGEDQTSMQRAMGMLKQAAPFVARLLPLIDGNFAAAIGNLFAPRQQHTPSPAVTVDLAPLHNQLSEMQLQQNELRSAVQEQTTGIKRVEDQLELVREATDRNTLEQQELIEDLKAVGHKVNLVAAGVSILLVLSVVINLILYLYIKKVLP
jgi:hypothetical protein